MSSPSIERGPISATEEEQATLHQIEKVLEPGTDGRSTITGPDGTSIDLPDSVVRALREVVHRLSSDEAVSIVPVKKELTTQQAADLLNVSRPHLIQLLEQGIIPHHRTGTHRRIEFRHLMRYKEHRDQARRDGLRELTRLSQEMGLYDYPDETP